MTPKWFSNSRKISFLNFAHGSLMHWSTGGVNGFRVVFNFVMIVAWLARALHDCIGASFLDVVLPTYVRKKRQSSFRRRRRRAINVVLFRRNWFSSKLNDRKVFEKRCVEISAFSANFHLERHSRNCQWCWGAILAPKNTILDHF